jgi:hypothetical protein
MASAASFCGKKVVLGYMESDGYRSQQCEEAEPDRILIGTSDVLAMKGQKLRVAGCSTSDFRPLPRQLPDEWFCVSRGCSCKCDGCNDGKHCLKGDDDCNSYCSAKMDFVRQVRIHLPLGPQTCDDCGTQYSGTLYSGAVDEYLVCCVQFLLAVLPPGISVPRMSLESD